MVLADAVLDPAHHADSERRLAHDVEDAEPLLAEGHDVAPVIVLGLAVQDLGTAANIGHALLLGIPAHHTEAAILRHHGAEHHAVAGFEDVKRQHLLREEHHIGEGEQGQFPNGQVAHATHPARRTRTLLGHRVAGRGVGKGKHESLG